MTITIGSLSSGYGGLEMALSVWLGADRADVRWHSEIDADASRVLKTWWPEVPNLGSFADDDFWERAEHVHLMCGGIPCQPFSAAGRQFGEADARHLWPFWRRGIELHRPATVVFENVKRLTEGKMRPIFDGIIADLLTLGYDVRWCLLGACAVGAAHHRHRVFLLACRTRTAPNAAQVEVKTCGQGVAAYLPTTQARDGLAGGDRPSELGGARESGAKRAISLSGALSFLPTPSAVSYGSNQGGGAAGPGTVVRHSLDALARLELLPNADTAAAAMASGRRNLDDAISLLPTPRGIDGARGPVDPARTEATGRKNGVELASAINADFGQYAEAIARHEAVLGRPAPEPTEIGPRGGRRLAAAFSEWLMMLPEGHLTTVLDRNPALARAGNGVVPLQAATALGLLFADLTGRR